MTTLTIADSLNLDKTHFASLEELRDYVLKLLADQQQLPAWQQAELDTRMATYQKEPDSALSFEDAERLIDRQLRQ